MADLIRFNVALWAVAVRASLAIATRLMTDAARHLQGCR